MNATLLRIVSLLLLAVLPSLPAAQEGDAGQVDSLPLFASHAPLDVTIEGPLTTLMKDRPEEEYLDGTFRYTGDDGVERVFDLKVRARGNFRLNPESCSFAPLRLNFPRKQLDSTEFAGQDKLKLVTHCRTGDLKFEQILLREYVAYRVFRLLTDRSFSVRLLHIDYVDTESDNTITRYGFVIEDDDAMAERLGMQTRKTPNITYEDLEPVQANLVNVFAYMIGNTDFSLIHGLDSEDCCHNVVLLSAGEGPPYTPVPFDFDFSGLVNAPYAVANARFKLLTVRQRLYRGRCDNNALLPDTLQRFLDRRDSIFAMLDTLTMLTAYTKRQLVNYLNGFYADIANPRKAKSRLIDNCIR